MSIRYITTGDEKIARSLLGEGRHQLTILKNAMAFQKLQQLQRIVRFDDGTVIKCSSCFGQDVVNVYIPIVPKPVKKERKIIHKFYCWCNCCFTEGVITEVIDVYDNIGNYTKSNGDPVYYRGEYLRWYYPACCTDSAWGEIRRYEGIRYKVQACMGDKSKKEFICTASDFIKYEKKDKVLLLILQNYKKGTNWGSTCLRECPPAEDGKLIGEGACEGIRRPDRENDENAEAVFGVTLTDSIDGTYIIMPFKFPRLPSYVEESME